jgi:hypothetical protein
MSDPLNTAGKPWYASKAVWGSVVAIGAGAAAIFHYDIGADTQVALVDWLIGAGGLVGGAIALYGRIKATHKIG